VIVIDAVVSGYTSRSSEGTGSTANELKIREVELEEGAFETCRDDSVRIAST